MASHSVTDISEFLRPLTREERKAGLRALEKVSRRAEERLAERNGGPYEPSWTELIEETRSEEDEGE